MGKGRSYSYPELLDNITLIIIDKHYYLQLPLNIDSGQFSNPINLGTGQ